MKKLLLYVLILVSFLCACQDNWNDYYKKEEGSGDKEGGSQNLLEYLEAKSEYSEFVKLLKETGVSDELTRNQVLTVWAPTNATLPSQVATMSDKDKKTLCQNHMNYIALYNTKLSNNKLIKTLAGKNLLIKETSLDHFNIDEKDVVELNGRCSNGVVHEIAGWLVPRKSIYEYIVEAGQDYSIFRDTLLSYSDTIFQPGESFPLDVDSLGNTIYDSVFITQNPFLNRIDFRDEDKEFTLFLPSNKVIEEMFETMGQNLAGMGKEFSRQDTIMFFNWMFRAIMHKDKIEHYTGDFRSVYGLKWRAEKEPVSGREDMSNGYVYNLSKLHIPKFLYQDSLTIYPYNSFAGHESSDLNNYLWVEDGKYDVRDNKPHPSIGQAAIERWDSKDLLYVTGNKTAPFVKLHFKTVLKDVWGSFKDATLEPGTYNIKASFRTWLSGNVKLTINDQEVTTFNANSSKYDYKAGLVYENFVVKEEWGTNMLNIRLEDVGAAGRLVPEFFRFIPTEDNY